MSKIAVIYKSHYGTTKQYAEWIAEALGASLLEMSAVKPQQLMDYDVVVYGGGLYAGGILGAKLIRNNPCKSLVVFTVGLADPEATDYSNILSQTFSPEKLAQTNVFHLRGGVDYSKLGFIHKTLMGMVKKAAEKKPETERTSEDKAIIETYGGKVDFMSQAAIAPLVEYVKSIVN